MIKIIQTLVSNKAETVSRPFKRLGIVSSSTKTP